MGARYNLLEIKNKIAYLEDISQQTGGMTITNDAENVYHIVTLSHRVTRVVYRCTDGTWWELVPVTDTPGDWRIAFAEWYGEAWDRLKTVD